MVTQMACDTQWNYIAIMAARWSISILVALIGGVEMRIATYEIAFCFHILLLSLLTVGRFRVSVSPTKENCPGVNQLEGGMLLVPCSTF